MYTIYVVENRIVLSHTVIIYLKPFGKKYVQLNLWYKYLYCPIKNLNVKIDDVIYGNDISRYAQAHGGDG